MDLNNCTVRILTHFVPPHVIPPHGGKIKLSVSDEYTATAAGRVEYTNLTEGLEIKLIRTIAEKMHFFARFL